jgi:hypothetical protein
MSKKRAWPWRKPKKNDTEARSSSAKPKKPRVRALYENMTPCAGWYDVKLPKHRLLSH